MAYGNSGPMCFSSQAFAQNSLPNCLLPIVNDRIFSPQTSEYALSSMQRNRYHKREDRDGSKAWRGEEKRGRELSSHGREAEEDCNDFETYSYIYKSQSYLKSPYGDGRSPSKQYSPDKPVSQKRHYEQITSTDNNCTFNSAQLTSFLARTADRTPKTFALQGDPSRSTHTPSSKRSPYVVSSGRPWRHMESSSTHSSVSSLLMEISRRFQHLSDPIFRRQICSQVAKVAEPDVAAASHPILIPAKLASQL
ncbi:hypothetical protein AVEN_35366-1 [Araneus ventricosus]|uniref:Uncharacterized protein n=1 Tax=Araneus ventricosus TaxID=182803 RepID=A0A4Y2PNN0_ARAVE|nr:hypothetical protein AVEN_35366-1 [Araneus ventricosus]